MYIYKSFRYSRIYIRWLNIMILDAEKTFQFNDSNGTQICGAQEVLELLKCGAPVEATAIRCGLSEPPFVTPSLGVRPYRFVALTSAPLANRHHATPNRPCCDAQCSGVSPLLLVALNKAAPPRSSKALTTPTWPSSHAVCKHVEPSTSRASFTKPVPQ